MDNSKNHLYFKKGDSSPPENYRPISLLGAVYKLHAKLILNRIQQQVDQRLWKTRYGFRATRSTSDPIHIIRRLQDLFKQKSSPLHLFFIDWKQAFDKVDHEALRTSLQRISTPRGSVHRAPTSIASIPGSERGGLPPLHLAKLLWTCLARLNGSILYV